MKTILQKSISAIIGISIFSFSFISSPVMAQAWQWAKSGGGVGGEATSKTCVDPSGNVFIAGYFGSSSISIGTITINNSGVSGNDVFVAKFDPAGNVQWVQRIAGTNNESVSGITCDATGKVYVAGTYNSPVVSLPPYTYGNPGSGTYNVYLACINGNGSTYFLNGYGGTGNEYSGGCAYSNSLSAVFLTGTYFDPTFVVNTTTLTNTSSAGKAEVYLLRIASTGVFQWGKTTGSAGCDDYSYAIQVDQAGNPCFFGTYSGSVTAATTTIGATILNSYGNQDMFVAKYNSSGTPVWSKDLGTNNGSDFPGGIDVDPSDNIFISGTFQNASLVVGTFTVTNSGNYDGFIAKYNSSGTPQWAYKAGGSMDDYGNGVAADASGNGYLVGSFGSASVTIGTTTLVNTGAIFTSNIFVSKYSATGTALWAATATGTNNETGNCVSVDATGNVYVGGSIDANTSFGTTTLTSLGALDLYLAKIGCLTTNVTGPANVCTGSSATLTATGATTYSWSTGGNTASIVITPTVNSTYTVTGTSGACIGTPTTINVTLLPVSLSAGSNLNMLCKQKSVINATCNPSSPTSVAWSPGTNLSSTSVLNPTVTAGTPIVYTVNVTLNNGCTVSGTVGVSSYAQTPDICQVTVDSLGNNNEIYWEKTLYPQADSFIVYRETSASVYTRIAAISRTAFSMYTDTNRSTGGFNGDPNLTYYRYKLQIKDSCGNVSALSKWHETIFVQDQLNGNFNWNAYAIELSASPVSSYNLKRRDLATGTETLVLSTGGNLGTDPNYATLWTTNIKWFVDAIGFNCVPSIIKPPKGGGNEIMVIKTKTKSNQSNDKLFPTAVKSLDYGTVIKVYPNPARDVINIDLNDLEKKDTEVEIQNMMGQIVYKTRSMNQFIILNTGSIGISDGVYFVNVKQDNKIIAVKKMVIN